MRGLRPDKRYCGSASVLRKNPCQKKIGSHQGLHRFPVRKKAFPVQKYPDWNCVPWAVLPSCGLIHTVTELSGLSTVPFPPVSSIYSQAVLPASIYAHTGCDIAPSKAAVINTFNTAFFNAPILIFLFTMIVPFHCSYVGSSANNLSDQIL